MQKKTLDKLRRYIDLAAAQASVASTFPPGWRHGGRGQLWQEFIEAAEAEGYVPDDARLDQALVDLYGSSTSSTTTMTSSTSSTSTLPYTDEWLVVKDPTRPMVIAGLAALALLAFLLTIGYFTNLLGGVP